MDNLIKELQEKIRACGDGTKESRARKGAYVDALCMVRKANVDKPQLCEVLAELKQGTFCDVWGTCYVKVDRIKEVLSKYFA